MTRHQYPHTIDNGAGERITFLRRVPGANGDRLEVENVVQPNAGPPMHAHLRQTECLTVAEGRIGWQRPGGKPQYAGPGETVSFGPGDAHRFWNPGNTPLRCTGYIDPADNIEYFLGEIFAMQRRAGPGKRVDLLDASILLTRFRSEFTLLELPAPIRRFALPVLARIARLLGRHRRFADAPEPVRGPPLTRRTTTGST